MKKRFCLILILFCIVFVQASTCSDTNEIDISKIPCTGFTPSINCSENIIAFNSSNSSINHSIPITLFVGSIYNFTFNLTRGSYELLDCGNNTATVIVGLFEQGYGINMFIIIIPSIILSLALLFISGTVFRRFEEKDEEEREKQGDYDFSPKSRLIPILITLFAFIPLIFMMGFVSGYLREYLGSANLTVFYGIFLTAFMYLFYGITLISFVVWASDFIKKKKIKMGELDRY